MEFTAAVELFFVSRAPRKDSPHTTAAYRRDLVAVARVAGEHLGTGVEGVVCGALSGPVMRAAFAGFSHSRSKSSIARAWSVWNAFFSFLVGEGVVEGNPMSGVARPVPPRSLPKPLRGEDSADRLLEALMSGVRAGRDPWPQRDVAVVAVLLLTGLRSGELLALTAGDVAGRAGEQRLVVRGGKGGEGRVVPVEVPLEVLLREYVVSRRRRFPLARWPLRPEDALFVDRRGEALTRNQLQYLVRQCYRFAGVDDAVQRGALV
ncbi:MAG: tyrosine-type recombinase/integrase, partial [Stackebrandtia sp.]